MKADGLKRPLSAYMLYNNYRRPVLRSEHPELQLTDLSKLIGDEWKKLSEDQKKNWVDKAKDQRLEYDIKKFNFDRKHAAGNPEAENGEVAEGTPAVTKPATATPKVGVDDSLSPFTSDDEAKAEDNVMGQISANKQQLEQNDSSDL